MQQLEVHYQDQARQVGYRQTRGGGVTYVPRLGSALNWYPDLHIPMPDGAHVSPPDSGQPSSVAIDGAAPGGDVTSAAALRPPAAMARSSAAIRSVPHIDLHGQMHRTRNAYADSPAPVTDSPPLRPRAIHRCAVCAPPANARGAVSVDAQSFSLW